MTAWALGIGLALAATSDPTCLVEVHEGRWSSREEGIEIFVQWSRAPRRTGRPVVLTHGAGSGGSSTWNLPGETSLLRHLACAGFDAYTFDARGFGGSTLPKALLQPNNSEGEPIVRARDVQQDLWGVLDGVFQRSGPGPIHLVGWSWGCVVAGMFASEHPDTVQRLALIAPVYDRKLPKRHRDEGVYRVESRQLHQRLVAPDQEDPEVHAAFVEALFRFVDSNELRLPNGPYRDLYGPDAPIWNAATVTADVLVLRGEQDFASRRVHALRLFEALTSARTRRYVEIGNAGHFLFRRHPAGELRAELVAFLTTPPRPTGPASNRK